MIQHGYINQWMINHDGSLLLATFIWVNYNIIIYYILPWAPRRCKTKDIWQYPGFGAHNLEIQGVLK